MAAGVIIILIAIHWIKLTPGLVVAAVPMSLTILLTIRLLVIKRYVTLSEDALLLPTGFLQLRMTKIPYGIIDKVWEARWPMGVVLYICVGRHKYEIPCGFKLKPKDYVEVRDYLVEVYTKNTKTQPAGGDKD